MEAAIRNTIGNTYCSLGEYGQAQQHHERARELRERELGPEHPRTLASMNNLAGAICQGRYAEAEKLHREVLELQKKVLGPEHPDTLRSMNNLANAIADQARFAEAEKLYREVLEIRKRVPGPEHPDTLMGMAQPGHRDLKDQGPPHPEAEQAAARQESAGAPEESAGPRASRHAQEHEQPGRRD